MRFSVTNARCGFLRAVAIAAAMTCGSATALADGLPIGQIKTVAGEVSILRGGDRAAARVGDDVHAADVITTGFDGAIGITFSDNTVMSAGPDSEISLEDYRFDSDRFAGAMLTELRRGTLLVVSGDIARSASDAMKVRTPTALLDVRRSRFAVQVPAGR